MCYKYNQDQTVLSGHITRKQLCSAVTEFSTCISLDFKKAKNIQFNLYWILKVGNICISCSGITSNCFIHN